MKRTETSGREAGRTTHQSLERGLRILELVASSSGACSLAETARQTGLHRSTTHHLMQALVGLGYLHQDPESRGYEPSARLFRLTGRTWTAEQLGEIAQPFIAELTRRSGEGSSLAAYRDGTVTIVAKHDPDSPVRVVQSLGVQRPIHATAVGKAIIPWLPDPELAGLLDRISFDRHTDKTITSRDELESEIRRIRAAGYAFDDEEHIEGIRCIAVPVFGHSGRVVASLCALGPKSRMTRRKLRDLRAPILELSRSLSERLGSGSD